MDSRPIGVFDSGMGGLTVLHECMVTLPHEDFVYLGDGARLPYGPRPLDEIRRFASEIAGYLQLQDQLQALSGARMTIAREYLDRRITREQAIALTQRYELMTRARAEQRLAFSDQYRSYVINYNLGKDMVARYINAHGGTATAAGRWRAFERLMSSPRLPSGLR